MTVLLASLLTGCAGSLIAAYIFNELTPWWSVAVALVLALVAWPLFSWGKSRVAKIQAKQNFKAEKDIEVGDTIITSAAGSSPEIEVKEKYRTKGNIKKGNTEINF